MSEYTKYFIIKSVSGNEIKEKSNRSKIASIVHSAKEKYRFSDKFKIQEKSKWFPVSAPAISGFKTPGSIESFFYQDRFDELKRLFEENSIDWEVNLKFGEKSISKKIYSEKKIKFNNEEKQILEEMFNSKFSELEPFLKPGKSMGFLNSSGIAYMQMPDQDRNSGNIVNGENYSFLASEIDAY